jgi:hypothetical protein
MYRFFDDLKIYRNVMNLDDCNLLQHVTKSVYFWCLVNGIEKVKQSRYTPWRRLGGEEV